MAYLDNITWKQIEDLGNKMGGEENIKRFLSGELMLVERETQTPVKKPRPLLKLVSTVAVPAVATFVVAEAFGDNNPAGIKFWLGDNFKMHFLGKTEKDVPAAELNIHRLTRASNDGAIRARFAPEHEETTLVYLYELLKKQPKGKAGTLLVNGYANIFYIRDASDNLWVVGAGWGDGSRVWHMDAGSVEDSADEWNAGFQVASRK